jgi:hypothetical protein
VAQSSSQAYAAQVDSGSQPPATQVLVDWHRTGDFEPVDVSGVEVARTLTSDLPAEVTLITGVAAATASMELTGDPADDARDAGFLYSPYRQDSPLYRVDVEGAPAKVLFGQVVGGQPELFQALAGQVRDLQVDADVDGVTATAQLVDGRQAFRDRPVLPLLAGDDAAGSLRPGLDVQWVVDQIARQAGYDSVPAAPNLTGFDEYVVLAASLHGSAAPDPTGTAVLASAVRADGGRIQYTDGAFALATAPDPVDGGAGVATYNTPPYARGSITDYLHIEMWIRPAASSYPVGDLSISLSSTASRIRVAVDGSHYILRLADTTDVTGPAIVNPTGWHYLGIYLPVSTPSVQVTWDLDGAVTTSAPVSNPLTTTGGGSGLVLVKTYNSLEGVQIWRRFNQPTPDFAPTFVPSAVLEPGLSELVAIPAISSDADGWSILQAIASGTGGVAFLDERDVFQFWNRRHFGLAAASTSTQRTIRASVPIVGATIQRLADRIRNIIRVPVTPYRITGTAIVWQLSDVVEIGPGDTDVQDVDISPAQAYKIDLFVGVIPSGGPLTNGHSGYRASRNFDGTGGAVTNLTMTITPLAGSIRVAVSNPNAYSVWLVSPTGAGYPSTSDGLPSMAVLGRLITDEGIDPDTGASTGTSAVTVEYRDEHSIAVYGERPLTLDGSVWRQATDAALDLAAEIGWRISRPRPQWPPISIIADASLTIGDRVWVIDDSGVTGIDDPAIITGYTTRDAPDGPMQDLQLQPIAPPGGLILGDPVRGTLDGRWRI